MLILPCANTDHSIWIKSNCGFRHRIRIMSKFSSQQWNSTIKCQILANKQDNSCISKYEPNRMLRSILAGRNQWRILPYLLIKQLGIYRSSSALLFTMYIHLYTTRVVLSVTEYNSLIWGLKPFGQLSKLQNNLINEKLSSL